MSSPASLFPECDPFVQMLWRHRGDRRAVPLLLEAAQKERGWVSRRHLELIAAVMDLPVEVLDRQVAVHPDLRAAPAGDHLVLTCDGLACHLGVGGRLHMALARELGIQPGQTTADGQVTWRVVPCLGACERAPAVSVDGVVLGPLDPEEAGSILRRLRAGGLPVAPLATVPSPPEGRVVRLAGRLRRPALVCVHPGETLANLVEQRGGGIPGGAALKAVLCGGMLIPARGARMALPPPDPEEAAGSALQILVLDEATCMVDLMALLMARAADRACGRCTLGRLGTRRMAKLAAEIRRGAGAGWIEDLQTLGQQVADGARCVGCRNPASAVVGALAAFPEEAWAHAVSGHCVAGTCRGTT